MLRPMRERGSLCAMKTAMCCCTPEPKLLPLVKVHDLQGSQSLDALDFREDPSVSKQRRQDRPVLPNDDSYRLQVR